MNLADLKRRIAVLEAVPDTETVRQLTEDEKIHRALLLEDIAGQVAWIRPQVVESRLQSALCDEMELRISRLRAKELI